MADRDIQSVLFPDLAARPVMVEFDHANLSSEAGSVLLGSLDRAVGLTAAIARALRDPRDVDRRQHELVDLFRQRVYSIANGYEDGNDAARLREDPALRLLVSGDPNGEALASQPTLSRAEGWSGPRQLFAATDALADTVLDVQQRRRVGRNRPSRIVIDIDSTVDSTHGAQQLSMFNGHHGTWCFLPLLAFVQFDGEPEHFLVGAVLRPGNAGDRKGFLSVLKRLLAKVSDRFGSAEIVVRLDSGFYSPELFDFLEAANVRYAVGIPSNQILAAAAEPLMSKSREESEASGKTATNFGESSYRAGSWSRDRRVIHKAEVVRLGERAARDNQRFVVTDFGVSSQEVWEFYAGRGDSENRIKELKNDLGLDRTSASSFFANQLRVLMTATAYALLQLLRQRAAGTRLARAQVGRLRDSLLKIGGRIDRSVRRICLHLSASAPARDVWIGIATGLGAHPA